MARKTIRYSLNEGESIEDAQDFIEREYPGVRAVSAVRTEGPGTYSLTFSGTGPGMTKLNRDW
jgi:hypothetical protein